MRHYPRCSECGAMIEGERDEEGFVTYTGCPNECAHHRVHMEPTGYYRNKLTGSLARKLECPECAREDAEAQREARA